MSELPDPFALARAMMAAQRAQLDAAEAMMRTLRDMAAWQSRAAEAAATMARAQQQWLALWGIR